MNKKVFICIIVCVLISFNSMAQHTSLTIDNQTPGWLSSKINYADQQTVEILKLTGYINGTDINFLYDLQEKKNLKVLDLADVSFVEGGDEIVVNKYQNDMGKTIINKVTTKDNMLINKMFSSFVNIRKIITPKSILSIEGEDSSFPGYLNLNADSVILNGKIKTVRITIQRTEHKTYNLSGFSVKYLSFCEGIENIVFNRSTVSSPDRTWTTCRELILPSSIKTIEDLIIKSGNIVSNIKNPQEVKYTNCSIKGDTIFIPQGTKALYQNSGFKNMKCFIEMNAPSSLIINQPEIELHNGEKMVLIPSTEPKDVYFKDMRWESSNENVATVNQKGEVIAVSPGTATITIYSEKNPEAKVSCTVTIYDHTTGIEMTYAKKTINVKENVKLNAYTLPTSTSDNKISWKSNDERIATVDKDGIVKGIKVGSCTITATTIDGGFSTECVITVVQPATEISIDKSAISIIVGNTELLSATVKPEDTTDKSITWSSSNKSVVTVDAKGKITAKKAGEATITAKAKSNSKVKAVCKVTVIQPVTGVTLNETDLTMTTLGEIKQLTVNVNPNDASNKSVKWTSSNTSVCTVSENGTIVAVGYGTSTIVVTTLDGGFVSACVITVGQSGVVTAKSYTRVYGEKNPIFSYSFDGGKLNGEPQITCEATEKSPVGSYPIIISKGNVKDNNITYANGTLTITKATLTVSTKDYTRSYGENNPTFEIIYDGFADGENASVLVKKPKATTSATKTSNVGTYTITIGSGVAENYDFNYKSGKLTIEKAYQTLTWNQDLSDVKQYDQVELTAKASSGLDVKYTIEGDNICSITKIGKKQYLDCKGIGEAVIIATQDGDRNYWQSTKVYKTVNISSPSGIQEIKSDLDKDVRIYDVNGNRIPALRKGINIIKYPDGRTRKISVK